MKIVVLAGGLSDERDVSLSSGSQVANALKKNNHDVLLLDLLDDVSSYDNFDIAYEALKKESYHYVVPEIAPDLESLKEKHSASGEVSLGLLPICQTADIVFLALHGGIGEKGKIQALFDIYNIKYTGSSHKGSAMAMDKLLAKELMAFNGINTPNWRVFEEGMSFEKPCVIKANDNGSSIGVYMADTEEAFEEAIKEAKTFKTDIIIEEKIVGREFAVGVLDQEALPIIEIIPKVGFYDYKNKYQAGSAEEVTPAHLSEELTLNMQDMAVKTHKALRLSSYSRIDFLMDESNEIYCIEANTLPGMTPTSLLPQEASAMGLDYVSLCEKLVQLSLEKYASN
ncbi:D-alanine--D-alanine ligase family protein [Vagococcus fluvialis]|uniref:D-alanine--D-alanine ligase family protein n=1 Tax=Vagococcus fluvialis TaxID=2738 RepID=UPI003B5CFE6D